MSEPRGGVVAVTCPKCEITLGTIVSADERPGCVAATTPCAACQRQMCTGELLPFEFDYEWPRGFGRVAETSSGFAWIAARRTGKAVSGVATTRSEAEAEMESAAERLGLDE